MPTPLITSPEQPGPPESPGPPGPSRRDRLGPRGLLSRCRAVPDADAAPVRQAPQEHPADGAPEPPGAPLPPALLSLPAGFEPKRDLAVSAVPAEATSGRRCGESAT
ncbi:hypothetical protein [Streptomyces sp. LaPpAH-108]|uniref:hypothetical protein n=1 Tax=Streptomyces sp. LaPpAH-108 TaxID=1155714 RepID=UPI0003A9AEF8|nr:hypothetical protein [Streptomyces sp. LaPpAH-108]